MEKTIEKGERLNLDDVFQSPSTEWVVHSLEPTISLAMNKLRLLVEKFVQAITVYSSFQIIVCKQDKAEKIIFFLKYGKERLK